MEKKTASQLVEVIHSEPDFAIGTWGDLFLLVWIDNTTVDGVAMLDREVKRFASVRPKGVGLLTIVKERAKMPPTESRQTLARFLGGAKEILVSAVVHEGSGFRAAAVRGIVAGLTMLARQPFPHKIFATINDASQWFSSTIKEKAGWQITTNDMVGAAQEFLKKAGAA